MRDALDILKTAATDHDRFMDALNSGDMASARKIQAKMHTDLAIFKAQGEVLKQRVSTMEKDLRDNLENVFGVTVTKGIFWILERTAWRKL